MEGSSRTPKKIIDYRKTGGIFVLIKKTRFTISLSGTTTLKNGSRTLSSSAATDSSNSTLRPVLTLKDKILVMNNPFKRTRRLEIPRAMRIKKLKFLS